MEQVDQLHKWLVNNSLKTLTRIVGGKVLLNEIKAAQAMAEVSSGAERYTDVAKQHIDAAARYRHFLEVLEEVAADKQPSTIVPHL